MDQSRTSHASAAVLEHLTGRSRGSFGWITGAGAEVWLDDAGRARLDAGTGSLAAVITRSGTEYDIAAAEGARLWVNRQPVTQARLASGDMVEFGETGPLSRFRVFDDQRCPQPSAGEILGDALSYMRVSRKPLGQRSLRATGETVRRLSHDTTRLFRGAVIVMLLLLTTAVVMNYRAGRQLRADVESGNLQVDAIAAELAQTRRDSIRHSDLNALRETTAERLDTLEARSDASQRVIGAAAGSVAFIQGGYGLRDRDSGGMLRHVLGPGGVPMMTPGGQPLLSLEGTGPVAEVQMTGTGFVLKDQGVLVTNRHVALPWESNPALRAGGDGMEPVMTRFIAWFPDRTEPVELRVKRVSETVDLALLEPVTAVDLPPGMAVSGAGVQPGQAVLVMGYPTGLMSLLAQSGRGFVEELQASGETGFWQVAERLAQAGRIFPLSSRGIVGQVTGAVVVYDAETTHGGSGGPVLNLNGEVVAVNTAILPEFGGSNLGVPAGEIAGLAGQGSPGQ
ncbi:trypsin-like peptidase domain-containing protein [Seohaeicola saemankumensis]|nr:serine protease [Seohaeicola saemankumensis]MCA0872868.1 trypsin-like peptidase domain-containing protein [Seohaeicola saemankumensis]